MKHATTDPTTRRRAVDPLDADLLEPLEERGQRLYAIVSKATRYRSILAEQTTALRIGDNPEVVRAHLTRWDPLIREIQRLAADI